MININFICDNGCDIDFDIPNFAFKDGYLIVPCPTCTKKYIVDATGHHEPFKHRMMQFPALHF